MVRHEAVTVLKEGVVPAADFADWKLAFVRATREQVAKWAGLSETTAIPEIVTDMRQDPHKTAQLAEGILSVLESKPTANGCR